MAVEAAVVETIEPTPFQARVLALPEAWDLFLGGGRGGGKSFTLALLALQHVEQYGAKARALYLRQNFPGLRDFEQLTLDLYGAIYGTAARYNAGNQLWRFPNGGTLELNQLETPQQLVKFQGRSITLLAADEAGEWPEPSLLDRMRSNLRSGSGVPVRMVMAANPGGPGHQWLHQRHVAGRTPWDAYVEPKTGAEFVTCPSVYRDNPHLDSGEYKRQLEAATATDAELRKAWLRGDWAISRGAYFAQVLGEHCAIDPWPTPAHNRKWWEYAVAGGRPGYRGIFGDWRFYLSHDFGSSAPSVTYLVATPKGALEGPDGRLYPSDSVILVDELATNTPDSLTEGLCWPVPKLAEAIRTDLCGRWSVEPQGVADDAVFAKTGSGEGSIASEFSRAGVYFQRARKADRIGGWEKLRRLMADAGKPDVPGLYVSRACEYFWRTVPYLGRDPRRIEDVDTRGADHAADAARYAVTGDPGRVSVMKLDFLGY